ncbi:pentatricopeptide repeat (PPR) superfamily protein [Striga asiatica]|uniref:Pentatricopeptide repeat (PPR) superfamily protein n=1 Tax=Striga asiatica TaxID=4170 RepID=A0A5A7Q219_STRAF|nr:pentatricopeptide repeat (PPR) superfamily protein [Striga asiatica]
MKFLGWMHRKLMHNGTEPNKKSTLGNVSACYSVHALFDEQKGYKEPTKTMTYPDIRCKKSSDIFESNKGEMIFQEESFESFDFLAIGTFGMELLHTDPPTPKLATPHENWTDPQKKITENDLKLINYELEKFLEAEEKEIAHDTSARSSQASIITLSHATTEGLASESQMYTMACPLQNYLFPT